jgi:hypothetical protein
MATLQEKISMFYAFKAKDVLTVTPKGQEWLKSNPGTSFEGQYQSMALAAGFIASTVDPAIIQEQNDVFDAIVAELKSGKIQKPRGHSASTDPSKVKNFKNEMVRTGQSAQEIMLKKFSENGVDMTKVKIHNLNDKGQLVCGVYSPAKKMFVEVPRNNPGTLLWAVKQVLAGGTGNEPEPEEAEEEPIVVAS